jgi:hypothetical protein
MQELKSSFMLLFIAAFGIFCSPLSKRDFSKGLEVTEGSFGNVD